MAECPECGADFKLPAHIDKGEIIECTNCGCELEVIEINPLKLQIFEEEEK